MEGIVIVRGGVSATAIAGLGALVVLLLKKAKRLKDALARMERKKADFAACLKPALDIEAEAASLRAALEKEGCEVEQYGSL